MGFFLNIPHNVNADKIKTIEKRLKELKKIYNNTEIRPCRNDAEIRIKDAELTEIIERIYALEKEKDWLILESSRVYPNKLI